MAGLGRPMATQLTKTVLVSDNSFGSGARMIRAGTMDQKIKNKNSLLHDGETD